MNDLVPISKETLTPAQFAQLADVPPELEWLANITNPKPRRAYKVDVEEFSRFAGLNALAEQHEITREIYRHAIPEEQRRAVESVERLVFGPKWTQVAELNQSTSGSVN